MLRKSLFKVLATGLAMAVAGIAGVAQAASCGINGGASAQTAVYDPFNPTGLANTTIIITMTRVNTAGGGDTREVNFFLRANSSLGTKLNGASIVPTAIAGSVSQPASASSLGLNIFYNTNQGNPNYAPTSQVPSSGNRFMKIDFTGGNLGSNTAQVTFQVSLPANLDITASQILSFDVYYSCYIQGGRDNGTQQTGSFSNAVSFPIVVLSAVRASYIGTALDFGEIGTINDALAPTINTGNSGITNLVRVQSSAVYKVTLSSENAFRLKHPSGSLIELAETVRYKLHFLGVDRDFVSHASPGATAVDINCARAGVPTSDADDLPLVATLQQGGQGKTPSPSYRDTLTITITPQADTVTSAFSCDNIP